LLGLSNAELELYRNRSSASPVVNFKCRTVRVGSYKVEPLDCVMFCPEGLRISLPQPGTKGMLFKSQIIICTQKEIISTVPVVLEIPRSNIVAVLAHLGRSLPVFFIYLKSVTCARIRALLNMTDPAKDPYFESLSTNETQRRITVLPESISDEARLYIKKIFGKEYGPDKLTCLEAKDANVILVKASPVSPDV
jgi:hypothetical protein